MSKVIKAVRRLDTNLLITILKWLWYAVLGKQVIAHQNAKIAGIRNIVTEGRLYVGTSEYGFSHPHQRTFLNIRGALTVKGTFTIGRGCRFDLGPDAVCELGSGYISPDCLLVIMHGLTIGEGVAIAWNCEFLDDDFHSLHNEGRVEKRKSIEIGNHVWIGSGVKILKGVTIASNNVIASNSLVTESFLDEGVLIAGSPARVVKKNVTWD